jgi:hypothetical protein
MLKNCKSSKAAFVKVSMKRLSRAIQLTVATGGKLDEIDNRILDHRQQELRAGKTIDPASKDQSGQGEQDAVMLCHALEGPNGIRNGCPKQQELGQKLDW